MPEAVPGRTGVAAGRPSAALIRLLVLLLVLLPGLAPAREVVDMLGRRVQVPEKIGRVFGAAPPINVLLHALAPQTLVGLSFPVSDEARPFFSEQLRSLPVTGGIFGMGQQTNPETLLALKPDIALAWASPFVDQEKLEAAFARIATPVLFVRLDSLQDWPAALRFSGRLLGQSERAESQARYVEQALTLVRHFVTGIPEKQRPRVYYAEGGDGLATDCNQSFHTEAIELAGGYNVYRCQPRDHSGMEKISLEQVIAFDPEIILTHERRFAASVRQDPRWQSIRAVRQGRIYLIPKWPHNWLDRPPSVMRALGMQWLASLFHPGFRFDRREKTREFYRLFFALTPSDEQIDGLFE